MNNGQLYAVSVLPATQMAAQGQSAPAAPATESVQEGGGAFAGMLSGIQAQAKAKVAADRQAELTRADQDQQERTTVEDSSVDLLALVPVASPVALTVDPAVKQSGESEKAEVITDSVSPDNASAAASQMAQAAYSQSVRMTEVSFPTQPAVDGSQNVAVVAEQPSVTSATPVGTEAEQETPAQAASSAVRTAQSGRMPEVNTPLPLPVDRLQNVATEPVHTGHVTPESPSAEQARSAETQNHRRQSETVQSSPAEGPIASVAAESVVQSVPQSSQSVRMSDVRTLTADSLVASADIVQVAQSQAEPVLATKMLSDASILAADSGMAPHGAARAETPPAKAAQASAAGMFENEAESASQTASAASPESEVEILLSQPRPVTRAASAPVSADHRFAALVQETTSVRQRNNQEQEQGVVNEMTSSQQAAVVSEEVAAGSDPSRSDNGTQGQPENTALSLHDMQGQFRAEHQKVASTTRQLPAEPVRENISEQVMQQVKDRLGQHDVKQGSQQITLTLSPDSLGELKMNLNLHGQKLSVEIVTENKVVRDSIVQHADALKDSLGRQNITMESFDVTTGGKGSGYQGQNQNAWRELAKQQQQQQFWSSTRGYQTAQADLPAGNAAYMKQQGHSMLDIHY